jgi:peptidoglycan/LPS O-acetylase OafA/YrhL
MPFAYSYYYLYVVDKSEYNIRLDIQFLRCLAVVAVVVNHLNWDLMPLNGGFRGVDVFFVISGYVITTSILRSERNGNRFVLSQFLLRRVRRLFPAVFVTAIAVAVVSLITQSYINVQQETAKSGFASVFFVINYWFARKHEGYFTPSYPNPLTHLWSLSVEEQFYLFLGIFFFAVSKAKKKLTSTFVTTVLFGVGALSLVLGLMPKLIPSLDRAPFYFADSLLPFYSLHTRAFQLLAGVLLAIFVSQNERFVFVVGKKLKAASLVVGTALLAYSLGVFGNGSQINASSVVVVLATVLLIAANAYDIPKLYQSVVGRALIRIGDYSYVLYLVHWPVIIYGRNLFGESVKVYISELVLMWILALLVGKYVERRLSVNRVPRAKVVWAFFGIGQTIVISAMAVLLVMGNHQQASARGGIVAWNVVDSRCDQDTGACDIQVPGTTKSAVLEGDSHAAAFLNSFVAVATGQGFNALSFAKEGDGLATLENTPFGNGNQWTVVSVFKTTGWANTEISNYVNHLRLLAKTPGVSKVVVFLDNPVIPNWRAPSLIVYSRGLSRADAESTRTADFQIALDQLIDEGLPISVIDPFDYVCTNTWCPTRSNGRDLYFDNNHLTVEGAARVEVELVKQLNSDK